MDEEKIAMFMSCTAADPERAQHYLASTGGNLEVRPRSSC